MTFSINFLPATYGDALFIEYGDEEKLYRVLIDGGTKATRHNIIDLVKCLPEEKREFELVISTHFDKDHIDGILGILEMDELPFVIKEIWFNGWKHLLDSDEIEQFGAIMAEDLTKGILKHKIPWNTSFEGGPVVIPADEELPVINISGGLKLTLLSPYLNNLSKLKAAWRDEVIRNGKVPGYGMEEPAPVIDNEVEQFGPELPDVNELNKTTFSPDDAAGNGSSIAVLAEFGGKRILLLGDALAPVVLKSLNKLEPDGKLTVDGIKLSHHGSRGNTGPYLIEKLNCQNYIISTNGSIYHHPHPETIAWIIKRGGNDPAILFNYRSEHNKVWEDRGLQLQHTYHTRYPEGVSAGIKFDLLP